MSLAVKLALSPLLAAQAVLTRVRMPRLPEAQGPRSGQAGAGPALRLLVAGDSSAAGVGVLTQRDALAPRLAHVLAAQRELQVHWQLLACSGLTTAGTLGLLQAQTRLQADVAVIVTGVNDVVDQVPSHRAVAAREALANWLRNAAGVQHVVFAPLPPVHAFHGLPQPLRWVAGSDARRHNTALRRWTATRRDVSCVDLQLPLDRSGMASDGFHPGASTYRWCADAIAVHLAAQDWHH
jgi:lysophospholipase L1-like esterase